MTDGTSRPIVEDGHLYVIPMRSSTPLPVFDVETGDFVTAYTGGTRGVLDSGRRRLHTIGDALRAFDTESTVALWKREQPPLGMTIDETENLYLAGSSYSLDDDRLVVGAMTPTAAFYTAVDVAITDVADVPGALARLDPASEEPAPR